MRTEPFGEEKGCVDKLMSNAMDTFEFMDGAMSFNGMLMIFNLALLLICSFRWYREYKRTGIFMDYMTGFYFIYIILPILIMYPFSGSYYNVISVGKDIFWIMGKVDTAYVISILGFISMVLGTRFSPLLPVSDGYFERIIKSNIENYRFEYFIGVCNFLLLLVLIVICMEHPEYIFNVRGVRFIQPSVGLFLNLIMSYATIAFLIIFILLIKKITMRRLALLIPLLFIPILMGNRSTLIIPIITSATIYFMCGKKIRVHTFIFGALILFSITVLLSLLRSTAVSDSYNVNQDPVLMFLGEVLYGNTFSDLRDFAWVLTGFNDSFLYGKTYLSALLGFIPSSLFEYRVIYGIGDITNYYAGIQFEHFGLRTGVFGESYINFGIFGVVITGFIIGNLLGATNKLLGKALYKKMDVAYAYSRMFKLYAVSSLFMISANWTSVYVFIVIHGLGYFISSKLMGKDNKPSVNT